MPITSRKIFRPRPQPASQPASQVTTLIDKISTQYRRSLHRHPFLLFGLPFISLILGASFLLTPATALRYERHDRKNRAVSREEALGLGVLRDGTKKDRTSGDLFRDGSGMRTKDEGEGRRPGTQKEEYYRLMAKDLDSWEQKRIQRWKGEPDGRI